MNLRWSSGFNLLTFLFLISLMNPRSGHTSYQAFGDAFQSQDSSGSSPNLSELSSTIDGQLQTSSDEQEGKDAIRRPDSPTTSKPALQIDAFTDVHSDRAAGMADLGESV